MVLIYNEYEDRMVDIKLARNDDEIIEGNLRDILVDIKILSQHVINLCNEIGKLEAVLKLHLNEKKDR